MSCVHCQSSNSPRERVYYDGQYNRYVSPTYSPRIRRPELYPSGYYAGWRTMEFHGNNAETLASARGDPTYSDMRIQNGRMTPTYKQEATKNMELEKMQAKMKFLEDRNDAVQTKNHNLVEENKTLGSQLQDERNEVKRLEIRMGSLREEFEMEKLKLEKSRKEAEQKRNALSVEANGTSTTNIISKIDRGVQVWAVCMGCQRKLEGCEKQPPSVTITRSELDLLEKDMQTLRDTIIAREEAWDKAMEREQSYRQQLTRLTTETITARHLSETRYEELQSMTNALSEKESEMKSLQRDNFYLNKLVAKLYNSYQRGQGEDQKGSFSCDINEKDQRFIEDVVRRVANTKSKQKPKYRAACSESTAISAVYQNSPREKNGRTKDQPACSKESKR